MNRRGGRGAFSSGTALAEIAFSAAAFRPWHLRRPSPVTLCGAQNLGGRMALERPRRENGDKIKWRPSRIEILCAILHPTKRMRNQ